MQTSRPSQTEAPSASSARPAEVDAIELRRILRLCSLPPSARRPITFQRNGSPAADWQRWQNQIFLPRILPRFLKAIGFARREQSRELAEIDRELAGDLASSMAASSALAGRPLIEQMRPARGISWVRRFEKEALGSEAGGQYAVCYALACAFFNVGTWNAILALLCEEHSAAAGILAEDLPLETREFALLLEIDKLRIKVGELESTLSRFHVA